MSTLLIGLCIMPLLIGFGLWIFTKRSTRLSTLVGLLVIINMLLINAVTLLKYGLLVTAMRSYTKSFYLAFMLSILIATLVSFKLIRFMNLRDYHLKLGRKTTFLFIAFSWSLFTYIHWLTRTSGTFNFEILLFNLKVPLNTTNDGFIKDIFNIIIMPLAFSLSLAVVIFNGDLVRQFEKSRKTSQGWVFGVVRKSIPVLLVVCTLIYAFDRLDLKNMIRYFTQEESFIEDRYVEASDAILTFPEKKRNLIVIFVESYESSFFDIDHGGAREYNLMPNMTRELERGALNFSHQELSYGGMKIMPGATWSIAGMTAMLSGLPYKVPVESDNPDAPFLPGIITIGDLLAKEGYTNKLMVGSDSKDFGVASFYKQHGNYDILDYPRALEEGLLPEGYKEWWGFEDKKLYDFSKDELTKLAANQAPFHMVVETSDTHFPDGYTDASCEAPYDKAYANSVACTDALLGDFINWIKQQDFYENTSIVVVGDHLSMDVTYFEDIQTYKRTVFNMFLNPDPSIKNDVKTQNRDIYAADMFPSMLRSIGVEIKGGRLALGTDLFSDMPTLFESLGVESVQEALSKRSKFYDEKFLFGSVE